MQPAIQAAALALGLTFRAFPSDALAQEEVVFHDDFSAMKVEMLSAGVIGAEAEYHYVPGTAPHGAWEVSCFRSEGSQRAWRVLRENGFGRKFIYQAHTCSQQESATTHNVLVAG